MTRSFALRLMVYTALLLLAFMFVVPVLFMLSGSLKPDEQVLVEASKLGAILPVRVDFENYADVFSRVDFLRYMLNSLIVTSSIVVAGLVVNSLAGYIFARFVFPGRDLLFAFVLAIMIVPIESIAVPLFYEVILLGWRDTYLVQIVPFIANAFSIYLFYSFFIGLPRELEEAARLDGAGGLRTFVTIIVPNSKPVFASVAILTFLTQWSSFLWPLMVTSSEDVRPLPLAIATFYSLPPLKWGDIFAFGVMMVIPVLIVFLIFQRYFVRGVMASGIKG